MVHAERTFGNLAGCSVALLGSAYRFDSEDTRNSPTLSLAHVLQRLGCTVTLHDPYVRPGDQNLLRYDLDGQFTNDLATALEDAEIAFLCTAHSAYRESLVLAFSRSPRLRALFDGCNFFRPNEVATIGMLYAGI